MHLLVLIRKDVTTLEVQGYANTYLRNHYGPQVYQDYGLKEFEDDVDDIYSALYDSELIPYFIWETVAEK